MTLRLGRSTCCSQLRGRAPGFCGECWNNCTRPKTKRLKQRSNREDEGDVQVSAYSQNGRTGNRKVSAGMGLCAAYRRQAPPLPGMLYLELSAPIKHDIIVSYSKKQIVWMANGQSCVNWVFFRRAAIWMFCNHSEGPLRSYLASIWSENSNDEGHRSSLYHDIIARRWVHKRFIQGIVTNQTLFKKSFLLDNFLFPFHCQISVYSA